MPNPDLMTAARFYHPGEPLRIEQILHHKIDNPQRVVITDL